MRSIAGWEVKDPPKTGVMVDRDRINLSDPYTHILTGLPVFFISMVIASPDFSCDAWAGFARAVDRDDDRFDLSIEEIAVAQVKGHIKKRISAAL